MKIQYRNYGEWGDQRGADLPDGASGDMREPHRYNTNVLRLELSGDDRYLELLCKIK